jgi:hypothetical protein
MHPSLSPSQLLKASLNFLTQKQLHLEILTFNFVICYSSRILYDGLGSFPSSLRPHSFLPKMHLYSLALFHYSLIPSFMNYIFVVMFFFVVTLVLSS